MNRKLKKNVTISMMLAIAIVLNIVEAQMFFFIPVPGAKLGLANIVTLIVLYTFGFPEAFVVAILRTVIASILMPGRFLGPTFYMSISGGVISVLIMGFFKKINFFGIVGTSLFGSLTHVMGQVLVGYYVIGEGLLVYLPFMLIFGVITGFLIGMIANKFLTTSKDWLGPVVKNTKPTKRNKQTKVNNDYESHT